MKNLQFSTHIQAPVAHVYNTMLGLTTKASYEEWTKIFNDTSTFEGSWEKGSKINFIGYDSKGEKGGMVSEIAENIPNKFVSIKHLGLLMGDKEITTGPEVEAWAGALENYEFETVKGGTLLSVSVDTDDNFEGYMNDKYPKALLKLKEMCEHK